MPNTYTKIASVTASGSSGTMSFSSIPTTYTDLCILFTARSTTGSGNSGALNVTFNTATGTVTYREIYGTGSAAGSDALIASGGLPSAGNTASVFANGSLYLPNYQSSNQKSFSIDIVGENNTAGAYMGLVAGLWNQTAVVNEISLTITANFAQYSTATLYGIKNS
jgi:hypothetical protein